ncbi:MAG TPA: NAD(P)H-dependent oxidoreductase [Acidobacteriota bacterium]|nr:NAD(P)H-dependent oxidoreductase [Acidobacteriota bacterium]
MIRLLAISGSLRAESSNKALLEAAGMLAPQGMEIILYPSVGDLPHYNPDMERALPPAVQDFRAQVRAADGLLISSPEYAHGVPGSLKNALDWLVGGDEFIAKPVALFNASPRATHAQAALAETLKTMSGRVLSESSIALPLLAKKMVAAAIVAEPEMAAALRKALTAFASALRQTPA